MVSDDKRTKGFYSTVPEPTGVLSALVPFSKYKMFMVVANNHFESPASNVVEFTTKEGGENRDRVLDLRCAPQSTQGALFIHPALTLVVVTGTVAAGGTHGLNGRTAYDTLLFMCLWAVC